MEVISYSRAEFQDRMPASGCSWFWRDSSGGSHDAHCFPRRCHDHVSSFSATIWCSCTVPRQWSSSSPGCPSGSICTPLPGESHSESLRFLRWLQWWVITDDPAARSTISLVPFSASRYQRQAAASQLCEGGRRLVGRQVVSFSTVGNLGHDTMASLMLRNCYVKICYSLFASLIVNWFWKKISWVLVWILNWNKRG